MEMFHRRISNGKRLFWEAPIHSVQLLAQKLVEYASNITGKDAEEKTACVGSEIPHEPEAPHGAVADDASTHKKLFGLCVEFLDIPAADAEAI